MIWNVQTIHGLQKCTMPSGDVLCFCFIDSTFVNVTLTMRYSPGKNLVSQPFSLVIQSVFDILWKDFSLHWTCTRLIFFYPHLSLIFLPYLLSFPPFSCIAFPFLYFCPSICASFYPSFVPPFLLSIFNFPLFFLPLPFNTLWFASSFIPSLLLSFLIGPEL